MNNGKRRTALDYQRKNRRKRIKTVAQLAILLVVVILLVQTIFNTRHYAEPSKENWTNHNGFIALSYFGVDRAGTPKLVAKKQLEQQLGTLYDQGYRTISQQDVLDFYEKGKPLPDKALFLSFEDGRNDSELFAQPLLEKYNFKATFLSYANKMGDSDGKFVQPKEMLKMMRTGYWELGTNGYRLSYINIFDRDGRYLGQKTENEMRNKKNIAYYNHYLMDFIRDENMIPLEDRNQMDARIQGDYDQMKSVYTAKLGFVPPVYMIMHANTLYGSMNRLVAEANDENIHKLFSMHFNRDGNMYNDSKKNLYDLTRVQPEPYWYTNHLLMKVERDAGQQMEYIKGDEKRASQWQQISGATEYLENKIALTSTPAGEGKILLKDSMQSPDLRLSVKLTGNVVGKQMVYVRDDEQKQSFIRIVLDNNELRVEQKKAGQAVEILQKRKLDTVQWRATDLTLDKAGVYSEQVATAGLKTSEDEYPVNVGQTRNLEVTIQGSKLDVNVDGEPLFVQQSVDASIQTGGAALGSEFNKQNTKDDIYDGVFESLKIEALKDKNDGGKLLWSSRSTGMKGIVVKVQNIINASIDWAIDTF
ncbi:polysaccharide deacetylase family protein [Paenibacillus sp. HJL G12]|uniref:Polysaccharide deacetylase family protein n=1 Tax=Paenibacillus dendrobii TaxID=2691084 RepID=A0A7X3LIP4_9BACL|nr:polysaccharide deacetylase family protein [Paenibacillus dendrobii]MWV46357.1 polysaccharide deacetylase family protein [Paenibacillus dendrobii]